MVDQATSAATIKDAARRRMMMLVIVLLAIAQGRVISNSFEFNPRYESKEPATSVSPGFCLGAIYRRRSSYFCKIRQEIKHRC
jgi:hypothetical protein